MVLSNYIKLFDQIILQLSISTKCNLFKVLKYTLRSKQNFIMELL